MRSRRRIPYVYLHTVEFSAFKETSRHHEDTGTFSKLVLWGIIAYYLRRIWTVPISVIGRIPELPLL